jgi:methyl-accepting chemotaxis protein
MLSNLSIRNKLLCAFAALFTIIGTMGLLSAMKLGDLNDRATELTDNWMPSIAYVADMQYRLARLRMNVVGYVNEDNAQVQADYKARIDENLNALMVDKAKYTPLISSAEERALYDDFNQSFATYHPVAVKVLALRDEGRKAEALAMMHETCLPLFRATIDKLTKIVEFNRSNGEAAGKSAHETYLSGRIFILIAVAGALAVATGLLLALVRAVAQPIAVVTQSMNRMAGGDLASSLPKQDRKDEIGALIVAMESFRSQLLAAGDARVQQEAAARQMQAEQADTIVNSIGTGLSAMADGDLTHRVSAELGGVFASLKADFNRMAEQLESTVGSALGSVDSIRNGSGEIAQAADDLAHRTESQAASLEETSAALDEVNATVRATADNARQASVRVDVTRQAAQEGGAVASQAIAAMAEVQSSSRRIGNVVTLIESISLQTNLLALNAGVEAARAGDAGRGFAVVANEVRALAQRSSEAAQEIKSIIAESTTHVDGGVDLVNRSGEALKRVEHEVRGITELFADVTNAAEQQALALGQVNTAIGEMNTTTQQNAAMVEQTTAASRALASEAETLAKATSVFKTSDSRFGRAAPRAAARAGSRPRLAASGGRTAVAVADDWSTF